MKKTLAIALATTLLLSSTVFAEIKETKEFRGGFKKYSTNTLIFSDFWKFTYNFEYNNNTINITIEQRIPPAYDLDSIPNFYFENNKFTYTTSDNQTPRYSSFYSTQNGEHYFTKEYDEINIVDNMDGTYSASPTYNYGYLFPKFKIKYNLAYDGQNSFIKDLVTSMVRGPQLFHLKIKAAPAKYGYSRNDIVDYEIYIPADIIKEWQELAQFDEITIRDYFSENSFEIYNPNRLFINSKDFTFK